MIIGRQVIRFARVASTMEEVDRLAAAGEDEGVVVVADEQTAGRGRAGRSWEVPAGTSVLCSMLLRPVMPAGHLTTIPLLAGVAVAEAIEEVVSVHCLLKWPNDVWIGGKKVAGILVTSRSTGADVAYLNLGIGVNVNMPAAVLPESATSLVAVTEMVVDRDTVLAALLRRFDEAYGELIRSGPVRGVAAWHRRAAMVGEEVVVETPTGEVHGRQRGVDRDGALLIDVGGAVRRVVAGDLTRGPRLLAPRG